MIVSKASEIRTIIVERLIDEVAHLRTWEGKHSTKQSMTRIDDDGSKVVDGIDVESELSPSASENCAKPDPVWFPLSPLGDMGVFLRALPPGCA